MGATVAMGTGRCAVSASIPGEYTVAGGYLPGWEMCALPMETQ